MPCFNAEELFNNPHLIYREYWAKITHPVASEKSALAPSWKLSQTPAWVNSPAPLFGQHRSYVLKELPGLTDEKIRQLEEEKVIY